MRISDWSSDVCSSDLHKINQYAEDLGARGTIDPLIALWVPYLLFAALAIWMYYTIAHVPGGQPIGALERVAAKAAQKIRGLIRSEEHTSELQSLMRISYAVFCLKKKKKTQNE